ncbi:MAG: ICEBs1 excisionase [Bacillus sp. (in: firmicutes)]
MKTQFVTAKEVSEVLGISRSKAYQIVREMNNELKREGYITVAGKCPVRYFEKKFYGFEVEETVENRSGQNT